MRGSKRRNLGRCQVRPLTQELAEEAQSPGEHHQELVSEHAEAHHAQRLHSRGRPLGGLGAGGALLLPGVRPMGLIKRPGRKGLGDGTRGG